MARIVALLVLLVMTTVAFGYPTIRVGNEEFEAVPVRVIRAAEPGPHHYKRGKYGFGGGYGGYGGFGGQGGHGGYGGFDGGYGGGPGFGGYGGYPQGGGNSQAQSSANAASFNTPFGSASFASSNANAQAGGYGR